jgi:DNA topoisomerase IA
MDRPVLLVLTERPTTAEKFAKALMTTPASVTKRKSGECAVYEGAGTFFCAPWKGQTVTYRITAASGNLYGVDVVQSHTSSDSLSTQEPLALKAMRQNVIEHIRSEGEGCRGVLFALDDDRKAEGKCVEIMTNILTPLGVSRVYRATIKSLEASEIKKLDWKKGLRADRAEACKAAQEINARVGASFSRFMTRLFHGRYDSGVDSEALCFGAALTPTLAVCAGRFVPKAETVSQTRPRVVATASNGTQWLLSAPKGRAPTLEEVRTLHAHGLLYSRKVRMRQTEIRVKEALTMPSLMILCSFEFGICPTLTASLAESLYLDGFITYPRTTCKVYPKDLDYVGLYTALFPHGSAPSFVDLVAADTTIADSGVPILPTLAAAPFIKSRPTPATAPELSGDKRRVFDVIVSFFEQQGKITRMVEVHSADSSIGTFVYKSVELNYPRALLEPCPPLPKSEPFEFASIRGQRTICIRSYNLVELDPLLTYIPGKVQMVPPSAHDVIARLAQWYLGKDGTLSSYLGTIYQRKHAVVMDDSRVHMTNLGQALLEGFSGVHPDLVSPRIRQELELALLDIERGKSKAPKVVARFLGRYKEAFESLQLHSDKLLMAVDRVLNPTVVARISSEGVEGYTLLWCIDNVGRYFSKLCEQTISQTKTYPIYDTLESKLCVYGDKRHKDEVAKAWTSRCQTHLNKYLHGTQEITIQNETMQLTVGPGLVVRRLKRFLADLVVQVRVTFNSTEMQASFLRDKHVTVVSGEDVCGVHGGVTVESVKYDRSKQLLTLCFERREDVATFCEAVERDPLASIVGNTAGRHVDVVTEASLGQVLWHCPQRGTVVASKTFHQQEILLRYLPPKVKLEGLAAFCRDCGVDNFDITLEKVTPTGEMTARIVGMQKGAGQALRDGARTNQNMMAGVVAVMLPPRQHHGVTFISSQDAESARNAFTDETFSAEVTHDYFFPRAINSNPSVDVYPAHFVAHLGDTIFTQYGCAASIHYSGRRGRYLRLRDGKVAAAVKFLQGQVQPARVECKEDGVLGELLSRWESDALESVKSAVASAGCEVVFTKNDAGVVTEATLYGTPVARGSVLAQVTSVYQELVSLVADVAVDASAGAMFLPGGPGSIFLQGLTKDDDVSATYLVLGSHRVIRIVTSSHEATTRITSEIEAFLETVPGQRKDLQKKCWCGKITTKAFTMCGHGYCTECLGQIAKEGAFPMLCPHKGCPPLPVEDFRSALPADEFDKVMWRAVQIASGDTDFMMPCFNETCTAQVPPGYQFCATCGTVGCALCKTTEPSHGGIACEEFRKLSSDEARERYEKRLKNMDTSFPEEIRTLMQRGKEFINTTWRTMMPQFPEFTVTVNTCALNDCPARTQFQQGVIGTLSGFDTGFFAWHGTGSMEGIYGISHESWDVRRRAGQVFGPGEYFGETPGVSHGYSGSLGQMLVSYILQGPFVKHVPGFCYVVNNPTSAPIKYCIPLLVVTYGPARTPPTFHTVDPTPKAPPKENVATDEDDEKAKDAPTAVEVPYRFQWKDDTGAWQYYNVVLSSKIETAYDAHQRGAAPATHRMCNVVRFVDDRPQDYDIEFDKMLQRNVTTGFMREIRRVKVATAAPSPVASSGGTWLFLNESSKWTPLDPVVRDVLERGYRAFQSGSGPAVIVVKAPGRPEQYEVNLVAGTQTNKQTHKVRKILRK